MVRQFNTFWANERSEAVAEAGVTAAPTTEGSSGLS